MAVSPRGDQQTSWLLSMWGSSSGPVSMGSSVCCGEQNIPCAHEPTVLSRLQMWLERCCCWLCSLSRIYGFLLSYRDSCHAEGVLSNNNILEYNTMKLIENFLPVTFCCCLLSKHLKVFHSLSSVFLSFFRL